MTQGLIPRYKLLITYDIKPESMETYYQFVFQELIPAMQGLGVFMVQAYHTAYGNYPIRQLDFVAEDKDTIVNALDSAEWKKLKKKFDHFTTNYTHKIIHYREGFQF